ncbi:ComEC/Rec2 family competence protein [Microlunatus flavus]|uniref:Competence protein ComEC n=1 Tax=Microlunatus flavus TaxID=1036181 RepID=A0A1H9DC17_9ACTN|nr:ComEC/Rec2 family competence protein [Microlunatus flavus]SEQ11016.1 competence protein ComEC [Microlunatus flavus]
MTTHAPDLRMVAVAVAAWGGAWLGTSGSPATWGGVALVALLVGLVAWRRGSVLLLATAVVLAVTGATGAVRAEALASGPVATLAAQRAVAAVVLEVRGDARVHPAEGVRPAYATLPGLAVELDGRGRTWRTRTPVLVVVTGGAVPVWSHWPVGSRVRVSGRLEPAERGDPYGAVLRVRTGGTSVRAPPASLRLVERVRQGLRASVAHRRSEPRALVPALVLGDTSALTPAVVDDFRTTGLSHLTAVSGANLTLLLAFCLLLARWAGVRGWALRAVGLATVVVFVGLCRSEPSVLRAAAMGLVALAALGAGGRAAGMRHLAVASTGLLLLDPYLGRSVGFALSVLASGGIVWWAGPWSALLRRWLPGPVAEAVAVPLAAHLATLPVVAAISGRVSVSGLLANAVAGPFVGPATVLGFAAAGASLASAHGAAVLGFGAAWSAQPILWVAHAGAVLPGSAHDWPASPFALGWLAAACLAVGLLLPHVLVRRWLVVALAVLMVLALLAPPHRPGWPPRDWVLVACDVGQGDGLVLRAGERDAVVVDTGPDPALLRRCLDELGVRRVPLLVLTHFHDDHTGGLDGVLGVRPVGQVWVSPLASPSGEAARVRAEAAGLEVPVLTPALGARATVGAVGLEVLGPRAGPAQDVAAEDESGRQNDASLVVMATVSGVRVLLSGDVEPPGQEAVVAAGVDLHADVLKVPHHGSSRQDEAFLAATHARLAIASAGVDNDYGHPAPSTVARLRALGMQVLATNEHGAVAVEADGGRVLVASER